MAGENSGMFAGPSANPSGEVGSPISGGTLPAGADPLRTFLGEAELIR